MTAPTRIAYLVSRYPAVSHTFILREVRRLRAQGFDIHPISVNSPDRTLAQMSREEFEETRRTLYLKAEGVQAALGAHLWTLLARPQSWARGLASAWRMRRAFGLGKALAYFTEALMVGRELSINDIDHLHVHFASAAASVAMIARRAFDIRLSMTVHGPDEFDDVARQALREKIAAADSIVCISDFARGQLMRLSDPSDWSKMTVIRLGVDPRRYLPQQAAATHGAAPDILCVGRLVATKGQRLLVHALPRLLLQAGPVTLTLVGGGPEDKALRKLAADLGVADRVRFTGPLSEEAVLQRLCEAQVFALPSFAEGIPVVLMEAMACGLPCVSTTANGIPELVRHGEHGLLVTPGDLDGLVAALATLLRDAPLRERMGRAGRAQVEAFYDLDRNVQALAVALRDVARAGSRDATPPPLEPNLGLGA